jgi:HlyD family secretion protein
VRRRAPVLALILAIAAGASWLLLRAEGPDAAILAAGTVEARESDLGFRTAGRIELISVDEGDRISEGQLLALLDQQELAAALSVARARAEAAGATLEELTEGFRSEEIEQARAALRAAERRRLDATRDLERATSLYENGAISEQALDDRETVATVTESEMQGASERLRLLESGTRSERISAQRAALAASEAEVERVEALLEHAQITAPNTGLITIRHREPGEIVSAGAAVLTLMNPDDRWVRIYVRADRVGRLSIGQTATITADAYPERTYTGRGRSIVRSEARPRGRRLAPDGRRLTPPVAREPWAERWPALPYLSAASPAGSGSSWRCEISASTSGRASCSESSVRTEPGRRPRCACWPACCVPARATRSWRANRSSPTRSRSSRTSPTCRSGSASIRS